MAGPNWPQPRASDPHQDQLQGIISALMLKDNPTDSYDRDVAARLLDFFRSGCPWQRRLWGVGVVLGLQEVLEASNAVQSGS